MKKLVAVLAAIALVSVGGIGGALIEHAKSATASRNRQSVSSTTTVSQSTGKPVRTVTPTNYPIAVGTTEAPTRAPTANTATTILLPAECHVSGGTATATGTFNGSFVPEEFIRSGDVVELYVYSSGRTGYPGGTQLAKLATEHPYPMSRPSPWIVSVPVDQTLTKTATVGSPARCSVTVQPTHAFMGAGQAGS